jgi:hypothetical protein
MKYHFLTDIVYFSIGKLYKKTEFSIFMANILSNLKNLVKAIIKIDCN